MASCCVALKLNAHLLKPSGDGFNKPFLGDVAMASFASGAWPDRVAKNLITENKLKRRIKPGVSFSVLTSDDPRDTLVT